MHTLRLNFRRDAAALAAAAILILAALAVSPAARAEPSIADPSLTQHVEREILADPAVPYDTIDVVTTKGMVTLASRDALPSFIFDNSPAMCLRRSAASRKAQ
jgi:hypothetical protein